MRRRLPLVLFLVSGAASLVLEVVWLEALGRVFGSTARAAATTLAAFFLGLGVGAHLGGRLTARIRRPLRAYGFLEVLVAGGALLSLALVPLEEAVILHAGLPAGGVLRDLVQLLLAFVLLAPATVAMGATWPLLVESGARAGRPAAKVGALLQAVNTLGAAAGTFLAGFVLPPWLGMRGTLLAAAGTSALVGLLAVRLDPGPRPAAPPPRPDGAGAGTSARALAFLTGFLGFALQVLAVRAFSLVVPASIQVFALVLVVWLAALSVGAVGARLLVGWARRPRRVLVTLLALAGVLVAASVPLLGHLTDGLRPPSPDLPWSVYLLDLARTAVLVVGPPVTVLGAAFPFLLRTCERERPGRAAGALLATNTAGAILGALLAGFGMLPVLGLWTSIRLVGLLAALVALTLAWGRRGSTALAAAAVLVVSVTLPWPTPVIRLRAGERLAQVWEGRGGIVAIVQEDEALRLVHDNVFVLGGSHDRRWEALQAHIPLAIHPAPRQAFFLGLGTGITAGAALDHPLARVDVAELMPEVIEAARIWFAPYANGLFEDPRVHLVAEDGRYALQHASRAYDVVVGDLFFPWQPGTAYLYTREHLETVRERLAPGGHFAQWLPCYQLAPDELRGILATFVEVFPLVTLWRGDFFVDRPILAVVGHRDASTLDGDATVANAARLVAGEGFDLARDAETVPFHLYVGNLTRARAVLAGVPILEDDRPWIQWSAPRSERVHRQANAPMAVGEALLALETAIRDACPVEADPYLRDLDAARRGYVEAGLEVRRMAVHMAAFRRLPHARALRAYCRRVPARVRPPLGAWIE